MKALPWKKSGEPVFFAEELRTAYKDGMTFSGGCENAIDRALIDAHHRNDAKLLPEHLLIGILSEPSGTGRKLIQSLTTRTTKEMIEIAHARIPDEKKKPWNTQRQLSEEVYFLLTTGLQMQDFSCTRYFSDETKIVAALAVYHFDMMREVIGEFSPLHLLSRVCGLRADPFMTIARLEGDSDLHKAIEIDDLCVLVLPKVSNLSAHGYFSINFDVQFSVWKKEGGEMVPPGTRNVWMDEYEIHSERIRGWKHGDIHKLTIPEAMTCGGHFDVTASLVTPEGVTMLSETKRQTIECPVAEPVA